MPIPGLSELAAAGKLAWNIHNLGSSKYTNAQQEFTEFITDVSTLAKTLDAITEVVTAPRPGGYALDLQSEFVQSIIVEAKETLSSCQRLIQNNASFQKDRTGYVTNILWHLTIAQHVERQQIRIQVCFQKANFILGIQANGSILRNQELAQEDARAGVEEILQELRGLRGQLGRRHGNIHNAPYNTPNVDYNTTTLLYARVSERFEESLTAVPPNKRPTVAQRIDAVWIFYNRSTHSFEPQSPMVVQPSPLHYLNLLKCIWLLHHIQGDRAFINYYEKPFCAAWTRSLTRKVKVEATRFLQAEEGIQRVSEGDLLRLSDFDFCIDPRQTPSNPIPSPYEPSPGEELLMRSTLQVQDQRIVQEFLIFRIAESGLRLRTLTSSTRDAVPNIDRSELDGRKAYFNPIYALDDNALPSVTWKATTSDQGAQEVTFTSLNEARKFQQCVTNFGIACDETGLVCVRKKCGLWDGQGKVIGGKGRVQVWMHEVLASSRPSNGGTSHNSPQRRLSRDDSVGQSFNSWPPSNPNGTRIPSSIKNDGKNWVLTDPVRPQLVLLTEECNVKRLISITIDEYTRTSPDKCHCSKNNSRCREIIVERLSENFIPKKLEVRQYDTNSHSTGWNIAVLGKPQHVEAANMELDEVKYLSIQLSSVECRLEVEEKINTACKIIRNKVNEYHRYLIKSRRQATFKNE